jgi:hypothetical protein
LVGWSTRTTKKNIYIYLFFIYLYENQPTNQPTNHSG